MVARIISGKSIRGLLNYNERKVTERNATLIMASRFGTDPDKLSFNAKLNRFSHLTSLNSRVKTNALHVMLNFDRQDKLSHETFSRIAASYMDQIGFGDQPYLVYHHRDVSHPHIHIVTTNIRQDGSRIDIHGIGRTLSEVARKKLEIEFNLVKAEGRRQSTVSGLSPVELKKLQYGKVPTKRAINTIVNEVFRNYKFTSLEEYNTVLRQFNVMADPGREGTLMAQKKGLVYSMINAQENRVGIPFKASILTCKPSLSSVMEKVEANREQRLPHKSTLIRTLKGVIGRYEQLSRATLVNDLEKEGVGVEFRENAEGRIYGVTFVDFRNKTVFKGSDLGKEFSAGSIVGITGGSDKIKSYLSPKAPATNYLRNDSKEFSEEHNAPEGTNYLETLLGKQQNDSASPMPVRKKKRKRGFRL